MPSPGRNALCSCGSGRKYKRCCGRGLPAELHLDADTAPLSFAGSAASARAEVRRADAVKARDERLSSILLRFAHRRFGDSSIHAALDRYIDGADRIDDAEMPFAMTWALFHAPAPRTDVSIARLALNDPRAAGIDPATATLLADQLDAWLGIWEVERVNPGVGIEMTDILTHETRFVHEKTASRTLVNGDILLARIVDSDGVSFLAGLFPHALSPSDAEHLAKQVRRACRVRTRPVDRALLRGPHLQHSMIDGWRRTIDTRRRPPTMTNTDGDLLVLTTDRFVIVGPRDDLIARLQSFPGAEREGGDDMKHDDAATAAELAFVITKSGNRVNTAWQNTVVGRVIVGGDMLRVETNSVERADHLRHALEKHLGARLRFRLRDESGAEALFERARSSEGVTKAHPPATDPELAAIAHGIRVQYMQDWMDQPVPALGGLTPRAAAAESAASRKALQLLLKDFEHHEARLPSAERVDISRLRRELLGR